MAVRRPQIWRDECKKKKKKKNLFPVSKYNIDTQYAYKLNTKIITAYRRLPESFYKLSMLATYNT